MQLPSQIVRIRGVAERWQPALFAVGLGLAARLWLILRFPNNFSFDGWQRWAGRDHIFVQDWLPVLQILVFAVAKLGGGVQITRAVLSLVSSLGVGAGALCAESMGGRPAAWLFAVLAAFGPFLVYSSLLYQEGVYLTVLFVALALALRGGVGLSTVRQKGREGLLAADLVFGLLPLVRYEGWPVVVVYIVWRWRARSLLATWGMLVWLGVKAFGVKGFYPSPLDYFEDWRGLGERFDLHSWIRDVVTLGDFGLKTGGAVILVLGIASVGMCWRARGVPFIAALLGGQLLTNLAWIAGLEGPSSRMLVLPGVLAAMAASVGLSELWTRLPKLRPVATAALTCLLAVGLKVGADEVDTFRARARPEIVALGRMQACPECRWWIVPRDGFGPRKRHDGCEIVQGMTRMDQGEEFWCEPWLKDLSEVDRAARQSQTDGVVRWSRGPGGGEMDGQYVVTYNAINPLLSH